AVVDFGRSTAARRALDGGAIARPVGAPRPRTVQPVDLGVAHRAEPDPTFRGPLERGAEALRLPCATAGGPGHRAYASTGCSVPPARPTDAPRRVAVSGGVEAAAAAAASAGGLRSAS